MYTLKQLRQIDKVLYEDFQEVRERVQRAVRRCPKIVTLANALKQQEKFNKCKRIPPDYESGER